MPLFMVCSERDNLDLEKRVKEVFPSDEHYILREGSQWLIDAEQTTQEVADHLGITKNEGSPRGGEFSGAVVFLVSTYWGNYRTSLWEWMELD